jgi:mRNA-degrading endonuclease RelE of RelBE toxin-antitoxin system
MVYDVIFSPEAEGDLDELDVHQQRRVEDAVLQQLVHQPLVQTRNRFPMRPNSLATWELRVDPARVYYDVAGTVVRIVAVGVKRGNRVLVRGKEIKLSE